MITQDVCNGCPAPPAATPKFQAVYNNITADGAKLVLLLRLSPLVPFNLLNYGLGEFDTSTQLAQWTAATAPCDSVALAARLECS